MLENNNNEKTNENAKNLYLLIIDNRQLKVKTWQ